MIATRVAAVFLGIAVLSACTKEEVINTPAPYLAGPHPSQLTVLRKDGTSVSLYQVSVKNEILNGVVSQEADGGTMTSEKHVAVPLAQVQSIKVRTPDKSKTYLAVGVGGGLAVGLLAFAVSKAGNGPTATGCAVVNSCTNMNRPHTGVSIPMSTATRFLSGLTHAVLAH
jgi:hypothetical protein